MTPSRLHKPDLRIVESAHGAPQKVTRWNEIRIEDRDQRSFGKGQAVSQRARFVAFSRSAPDVRDPYFLEPPHRGAARDDRRRLVVRVVENLDLEAPGRPFDLTYGVEHALRHVSLVVDRHLHADERLVALADRRLRPRAQPRRAPRQVEKVQAEGEEKNACDANDAEDDGLDQRSNRAYGRMVERTYLTRSRASGWWRRVHCMYRQARSPSVRAAPSRNRGNSADGKRWVGVGSMSRAAGLFASWGKCSTRAGLAPISSWIDSTPKSGSAISSSNAMSSSWRWRGRYCERSRIRFAVIKRGAMGRRVRSSTGFARCASA